MKPGDLVRVRWVNRNRNRNNDILVGVPDELVICLDPQIVTSYTHHGSYKGIKFLKNDGTIVHYPVDRWSFQVME